MDRLEKTLEANRQWAAAMVAEDPEFFERLSHAQKPDLLWIGCADSRVPANVIIGATAGEVFVHRNVANVVANTDINCLSVLQYAVEVLRVRHVIVCGHYGCGGVNAAMGNEQYGLIDSWLREIKDVYARNSQELWALEPKARADRLCELHVAAQVYNAARLPTVQNAWHSGHKLTLHGWIYGLKDGLIKDLDVCFDGVDQLRRVDRLNKRR